MCPGRVRESGVVCGEAKARAVNARSWADIPVVVPEQLSAYDGQLRTNFGRRTELVVYSDRVGCPMRVLILLNHHGYFQLFQSFGRQRYAYITTVWT